MAAAASYALSRHHSSLTMALDQHDSCEYSCCITRADISVETEDSYNTHEVADRGAEGVAILLLANLDSKNRFKRAFTGTGIDYWVGPNPNAMQGTKRLEVSGIVKGTQADVAYRASKKKQQTGQSAGRGPAIVVIVEFSKPIAWMEAV